jgi:hypothetical protein
VHSPLRCFVHIGPPKTGTSYLQSVFWASRDALAEHGLILPLEQRDHYHLALALRAIHKTTAAARVATVLERLAAAIAAISDADLLISQEQLAPATPAEASRLVALLSNWEVHVVITARDVARQLPSEWQQSIKARKTLGYADFLTAVVARSSAAESYWAHQDLVAVAARWSRAVPANRVHIVTVPPPGSDPSLLLARFCSVVGADPALLQTAAAVPNTSLGYPQAEVLRRVNQAFGAELSGSDVSPQRAAQHYLAKKVLAAQPGVAPHLPQRLHDWCRLEAARTVGELTAGGYDVVGDLDDLMPRFTSTAPEQRANDADVLAAAVNALATTALRRHAATERTKQLRKLLRQRAQPRR